MKYYKSDELTVGGYIMRDLWLAEANGIVEFSRHAEFKNEAATDGALYYGGILAFKYDGKFYLDCLFIFAPLFPCWDNYSDSSYVAEFDTKEEANAFYKEVTNGYRYVFDY